MQYPVRSRKYAATMRTPSIEQSPLKVFIFPRICLNYLGKKNSQFLSQFGPASKNLGWEYSIYFLMLCLPTLRKISDAAEG